jgi:ribosomal protein S27E
VAAATLDAATRRDRAPFTCPGCGDRLVPHLGAVRARHFAHEPGSRCPLTAPETALHLNAKERLLALCAEAFAGRGRVLLRARCPDCRRPMPVDLGEVGDEARDEERVGTLRPDVVVLDSGRPVLALEVRVTHAVDARKEAALAALGVPVAEVDAREEWEVASGQAIEVVPDRSMGFARCGACALTARAGEDRAKGGEAAEVAELEAYRARGLLGTPPSVARSPGGGEGGGSLEPADREGLAARFRCPDCGRGDLAFGERLARHACPGREARPVAWRGYDGALVELGWWRPSSGKGA